MGTFIQLGLAREVKPELNSAVTQLHVSEQQVLELAKQERSKWQGAMNELDLIACMVLATAWSGQNAQNKGAQCDITKQTVAVVSIGKTLYFACDGLTWEDFTPTLPAPKLVENQLADPENGIAFQAAALSHPHWTEKQRESYLTSPDKKNEGARIADPSYTLDLGLLKFRTQQAVQHSLRAHGEERPVVFINTTGSGHSEMRLLEFMADRGRPDGNLIGVSKPCCERCKGELEKYKINFSCWHNFKVGNWAPPQRGPV